jgi:transcriptional regulator with XRE-family HTH domain
MTLTRLVASRLRELRVRHRFTQEEAAEVVGVALRFYQLLESGQKKQMWVGTLERLATSFGLQPWQLIGPELPAETTPVKEPGGSAVHRRKRRGAYNKEAKPKAGREQRP